MTRPVIHWFRRDLRLKDNTALIHAIQSGQPVLPLFVFDDQLLQSDRVGAPRLQFLLDALKSLNEQLQAYGSQLVVQRGEPQHIIQSLVTEVDASALYANADYSPYARRRDEELCNGLSIPTHIVDDVLLVKPGDVLKADGDPYVVFTPFKKRWNEMQKAPIADIEFKPEHFYKRDNIATHSLPDVRQLGMMPSVITVPPATTEYAMNLLHRFANGNMRQYDESRNYLPINPYASDETAMSSGTSYLSPYLRLGIISPRQCYWVARDAYANTTRKAYRDSITTWVSELTWREFYTHILYHFPHVLQRDFVDTYTNLQWHDDNTALEAWKSGQTGYPIIDAPMRQLRTIGWMPNRARMIVSSFLTKDLLIHWRAGDIHFMQHLIDGDPAANNGGWQWAAGTGTDAQPYFRIFNPISQSEKFATPAYLKHWLPELRSVPDQDIHTPWRMPTPPAQYPLPIVDHKQAREATLQAFKQARASQSS